MAFERHAPTGKYAVGLYDLPESLPASKLGRFQKTVVSLRNMLTNRIFLYIIYI